jgi:hypothetical protein
MSCAFACCTRCFAALLLPALLLAAGPHHADAAGTDVIVLTNGDRVTGEVKNLERGQLEVRTTPMSTVYIEWVHVAEITTDTTFELETSAGDRYVGRLLPVAAGRLAIEDAGARAEADLLSVVRLRQIRSRFWQNVNGQLSIGGGYTKSSGVGQGSIDSDVHYRRPAFELTAAFDGSATFEADQPTTSRSSLRFGYARLLRNRWLIPAVAQFERNQDQGLDLRSAVGGGVGRFLVQSNRAELMLVGGVIANREQPIEGDHIHSVEAMLMLRYSFFTYDTPKTYIDLTHVTYPSLSDPGRIRLTLDSSVKREIIRDFTVGVSLYDTFDNRPPTEGASKNDVGVSISIGWIF